MNFPNNMFLTTNKILTFPRFIFSPSADARKQDFNNILERARKEKNSKILWTCLLIIPNILTIKRYIFKFRAFWYVLVFWKCLKLPTLNMSIGTTEYREYKTIYLLFSLILMEDPHFPIFINQLTQLSVFRYSGLSLSGGKNK